MLVIGRFLAVDEDHLEVIVAMRRGHRLGHFQPTANTEQIDWCFADLVIQAVHRHSLGSSPEFSPFRAATVQTQRAQSRSCPVPAGAQQYAKTTNYSMASLGVIT